MPHVVQVWFDCGPRMLTYTFAGIFSEAVNKAIYLLTQVWPVRY